MRQGLLKWSFILVVLMAAAPLVSLLFTRLRDPEGGPALTPLFNTSPLMGLALLAVLAGAALGVAAFGARVFTLYTGTGCAGLFFAWASWRCGTRDAMARLADPPSAATLAAEGALAGGLALGILAAALRVNRGCQTRPEPARTGGPLERLIQPESGRRPPGVALNALLAAAGAALAAGVVVGWIVPFNMTKGQAVMGAILAGVAAGAAAHLAAAGLRAVVSPMVPAAACVLIAVVGPIAGALLIPDLHAAARRGLEWGLLRPISLDWAAAVLLGVPLGMLWAGARFDERALDPATPAPRPPAPARSGS